MDTTPQAYQLAVCDEIRAVMARKHVKQVKLAADMGVPVSWLRRRLSGEIRLDVEAMFTIAKALDVEVTALMPVSVGNLGLTESDNRVLASV